MQNSYILRVRPHIGNIHVMLHNHSNANDDRWPLHISTDGLYCTTYSQNIVIGSIMENTMSYILPTHSGPSMIMVWRCLYTKGLIHNIYHTVLVVFLLHKCAFLLFFSQEHRWNHAWNIYMKEKVFEAVFFWILIFCITKPRKNKK